jgi:hypothetical protein
MAVGHQGEILLEDYLDIADMMQASGRVVPRHKWVDGLRDDSGGAAMIGAFGA